MGKKDLRKQYGDLDVSLIDYVSRLDPSKTKKLTPFLLKILSKRNKEKDFSTRKDLINIIHNRFDVYIIEILLDLMGEGYGLIETLREFNEHLENNRIENTDINQYETWEDLLTQKGIADVKLMDKQLTKQVERIYEDSTWLVIKPLSFSASLAYGSGTKWCTAMKREPSYFYRYASEGILLYVINKVNGKKYGFNSSPSEFSVWNAVDTRIDSIESGIPYEILTVIREKSNLSTNPKNSELFSDEEIKNKNDFYGKKSLLEDIGEPIGVHEYPIEEVVDYEIMEEYMGDYDVYESQAYSEEISEVDPSYYVQQG
jgi:hypothetical protein